MNVQTEAKTIPERKINSWLVYAVCVVVTLVSLFCFAPNSPIYTFNSHCDYNWYLTMGRGIVAGKVPYRDLFEHKGPITYFVFAFASLFPEPRFAVWVIEIICVSLFLFFGYRIARKFLSPWLSLLFIPIMMMTLSTMCFSFGTRVEEFCLPIFAYGLLCFLDFIMDKRPATWQRSLALGICLGILFWVKFSMWEFFLFPMLIWLIMNLVRRDWKTVSRSGLIMLGGLLIVTLPIIIYFGVNGAVGDLFEVYFKVNFSYSGNIYGLTESQLRVQQILRVFSPLFLSPYVGIFLLLGIIAFAVQYWRQKSGWLLLIAVVPTWFMIGFICGYGYYYLPLYAYEILGVVYAIKLVANILRAVDCKVQKQWIKSVVLILVAILSYLLSFPFVSATVEINQPRENYAPLVVADIIAEYNQTAEAPATLFCYYMADWGFYNACGIVPNVKYYAINNFTREEFPAMYESFDEIISEQKCDFVLATLEMYETNELLSSHYAPYFETKEDSKINFKYWVDTCYFEAPLIILFRKTI